MRVPPAAIALLALMVLAGCGGRGEESTPVACLDGARAYARALEDAPESVELAGGVPISDCLVESQEGGELAGVGEAMVTTATELNAESRANPEGPAALRLGYLLGAAERGAEQTEGIHNDLIRRLTVAARFSPEGPLPPAFADAYREGFDAGRDSG
ncbi:MAG TPA: hypothetical protein VGO66_02075 [Solirubrobacterales bacterium]|jgi:hypothetical protein|nr:hypothetical protein [Solirubrobacterales bacterium]